jgi:hypothetical protein
MLMAFPSVPSIQCRSSNLPRSTGKCFLGLTFVCHLNVAVFELVQFAYNEMSYVLIRLLQNFSGVHMVPDAHSPALRVPEDWSSGEGRTSFERIFPRSHLTMYANGGLWITLDEAIEKNE